MALQASIVDLPPRREPGVAFRGHPSEGRDTAGTHRVEWQACRGSLGLPGVDLMAFDAFDMVRSMSSAQPVAHLLTLGMATQAGTVGFLSPARTKADDLGRVSSLRMQAGGTVAIFAIYSLLGVEGVPVSSADCRVAAYACIRPNAGGARNLRVFRERTDPRLRSFLGCNRLQQKKRESRDDTRCRQKSPPHNVVDYILIQCVPGCLDFHTQRSDKQPSATAEHNPATAYRREYVSCHGGAETTHHRGRFDKRYEKVQRRMEYVSSTLHERPSVIPPEWRNVRGPPWRRASRRWI
jgi:hypothetical protein